MLSLQRLKVLRAVALEGSLAGAATSLNFSPSAVSQQVAQLEREVGAILLERRSTGVVLTPAGEIVLAHADAMLAHAAEAQDELRRLAEGTTGTVRVAAFASAAAVLLPAAIVAFRAAEPRFVVDVIERDHDESLAQLRRGELDAAVVVRKAADPVGVETISLFDDVIDVIVPLDHRLAGAATVSLEELAEDPWVDCSSGPVKAVMAIRGIEPNIVVTTQHDDVAHAIVGAGLAAGFLPRLLQPLARRDIVVKPIFPDPPVRRVALALRGVGRELPAVQTFVRCVQAAVQDRFASAPASLAQALAAHPRP
jgi:DNA-binding transcriptional LysR family regulator